MKTTFIFASILILSHISLAQNKKEKDAQAIKSMCGCYRVGFNFAETFEYSNDSTYKPSKIKHESALEWAGLIKDKDGDISIQHLLIVGHGESPMVIKHWRQDWIYENTSLYEYNRDNMWNFVIKSPEEVKGQWTQKVFQVDDSPRYEGSATWVHVDGKSYWENTTSAPLPRREYTQRSDYNVTIRGNRHEITADGWIHDQDNLKLIREEGKEDILLAAEKGVNTYVKVDDSKCQAAIDWWKENGGFWAEVRTAWGVIYGMNKNLAMAEKVEGKHLYEVLFDMDPSKTKSKEIVKAMQSFLQ